LKLKKKGQKCTFCYKEREKERKQEMTISDKPPIIRHHAPHQEEEDTMALPRIWRKDRFGHQIVSHALPKGHCPLTRIETSQKFKSQFYDHLFEITNFETVQFFLKNKFG